MLPDRLVAHLLESRGFRHKRDITPVVQALAGTSGAISLGDDCAAIPDGDGYLLFAIEGFLNDFVAQDPWFAGYCGIMVNVSDIAAMGGRPLAVVDALWSRDGERARPLLEGMAAAASVYGVPVAGGHTNTRNNQEQLAVAILGRANRLLTSFDARPGDRLVAVIDLRGAYRGSSANWNASTGAPPDRLRQDLEILPNLAEAGLCRAAKDISMAGLCGTALMLMEGSGVGGEIDLDAVPRPEGVDLLRWLLTFPSYGFLLAVNPRDVAPVLERFTRRGLAAAAIGTVEASREVTLTQAGRRELLWDFHGNPLIGCGPAEEQP